MAARRSKVERLKRPPVTHKQTHTQHMQQHARTHTSTHPNTRYHTHTYTQTHRVARRRRSAAPRADSNERAYKANIAALRREHQGCGHVYRA
jgi:hypothetical protein